MLSLAGKLLLYKISRACGLTPPLPVNLTLSVTGRCNSRCRTCNIWRQDRDAGDELGLAEWLRIAASAGAAPEWLTISGGEPFLRNDLVELVTGWGRITRPRAITIPTNGLLVERITEAVPRIAAALPAVRIIINFSFDGVGEEHDAIRGIPGNSGAVEIALQQLRRERLTNVTLGLGTVFSRFNIDACEQLCRRVVALAPDSFVVEIAEERRELATIGAGITPDAEAFAAALPVIRATMDAVNTAGTARLVRTFRRRYYRMAETWLRDGAHSVPCYAGYASAQITPAGKVWLCCMLAEELGDLRGYGFDLAALWRSPEAQRQRRAVRDRACCCPLANASYTNMLCDFPSLAAVTADWFF